MSGRLPWAHRCFYSLFRPFSQLPQTNLKDADAVWDFVSQHPESIHQFSFLFSDRGTPDGYRRMHGFSSHTYKFVNAHGEGHWVKLHYKTTAGIKNLSAADANKLEATDPDYATRDLFEHIESGKEAVWDVSAQFVPIEAGNNYKFNIFDLTKVGMHCRLYIARRYSAPVHQLMQFFAFCSVFDRSGDQPEGLSAHSDRSPGAQSQPAELLRWYEAWTYSVHACIGSR
jgi:hypothetical protein